jgi:membrane-associated phospholipid phosphatase
MRDKKTLVLVFIMLVGGQLCAVQVSEYCRTRDTFGLEIRDFLADFASSNFKLFNKESLLVLSATAPLYAATCAIDAPIHDIFYDSSCHHNTFDIGCCRNFFAEDVGFFLPLVAVAGGLWASHSGDNRFVGRDLMAGMVSIGFAKLAIKECCSGHLCYRPYSGCFEKKLVFGGFPSGHAAVLTYATTVLALHKGAQWAIPVGIYGGIVMTSLLICNYHYVSQLVAGAGLGALYAVATHKIINERLSERLECEIVANRQGVPQIQLAYSF